MPPSSLTKIVEPRFLSALRENSIEELNGGKISKGSIRNFNFQFGGWRIPFDEIFHFFHTFKKKKIDRKTLDERELSTIRWKKECLKSCKDQRIDEISPRVNAPGPLLPPKNEAGSPFRVPAGNARGHAVSLPNMAGRGILSTARARTTLAGAGRADRFVPLREHGDEAAASGENRCDTARRNRVNVGQRRSREDRGKKRRRVER